MKSLYRYKRGVLAGPARESYGEAFQDAVDLIERQLNNPPKSVVIQRYWSESQHWATEAFVTVSSVVEALKMGEHPTV